MTDFKSGYVALIGTPNAGKSTLLNQVLGSKLAITSDKPQTTRNRIAGIHTDKQMQVVFLDTPGIHEAWTELNRAMVRKTLGALEEVDIALWLGDMTTLGRFAEQGHPVIDAVHEHIAQILVESGKPVIFVANKIDIVPKPLVLPVLEEVSARIPLAAAVPTSALTGDGLKSLLEEIRLRIPPGQLLFPEDEWAQVSERFLVSEIIREKIFHLTEREIPYSTTVEVNSFDESERETPKNIVKIQADIIVERSSQKGIMIGKRGEMLKRIGTLARKEIQKVLDSRVHLELFVKVEKNWTKTEKGLRKVGFES